MKVRIIDRDGNLLVIGELDRAWKAHLTNSLREGMRAAGRDVPYGRAGTFEAPARTAHCTVSLAEKHDMPLWYGGTYKESHLDFSLPSGLHNVWGQGNDFDTDAYKIHPDDIEAIIATIK